MLYVYFRGGGPSPRVVGPWRAAASPREDTPLLVKNAVQIKLLEQAYICHLSPTSLSLSLSPSAHSAGPPLRRPSRLGGVHPPVLVVIVAAPRLGRLAPRRLRRAFLGVVVVLGGALLLGRLGGRRGRVVVVVAVALLVLTPPLGALGGPLLGALGLDEFRLGGLAAAALRGLGRLGVDVDRVVRGDLLRLGVAVRATLLALGAGRAGLCVVLDARGRRGVGAVTALLALGAVAVAALVLDALGADLRGGAGADLDALGADRRGASAGRRGVGADLRGGAGAALDALGADRRGASGLR